MYAPSFESQRNSIAQGLWLWLICLASLILRREVSGHRLTIGRTSLRKLTIHDVRCTGKLYEGKYRFDFKTGTVRIQFHLPHRTLPRWLIFTSENILYTSETCDVSASKLSITCWIFPMLFRQTFGQWANVEIDDGRVRVHNGNSTPYFVKRLRQNVVGAVMTGDIYRVDDFKTKISFSGLTEGNVEEKDQDFSDNASPSLPNGKLHDQNGHNAPQPYLSKDQDELCITALARGLHLHNHEGRIYTFGAVDAQFRRNWTADRGSFVMIAKENRWVHGPWPYQREKVTPWWLQLPSAILQFPYDLLHVLNYPVSTTNLYISRLDITFDEFRVSRI
ncbi:hypothetical protein K474DRAFT_1677709 [Panus rudis PR-1116 ss-1]|nr:hypothetical protein K474DRAFT_1677709 [Panus rudis PR-1116 ss-1]